MSLLKKSNMKFVFVILLFVVTPMVFIALGEYNIFSSLSKTEEKEVLQVIYSLGASLMILIYYAYKWLLSRVNNILIGFSVINVLGLTSLVLLVKTIEHHLVMDTDVYFLIVYTEIVIVHIVHHVFYKTSI